MRMKLRCSCTASALNPTHARCSSRSVTAYGREDDLVVAGIDRGRTLIALAGVDDLGRETVDVERADVGGVS